MANIVYVNNTSKLNKELSIIVEEVIDVVSDKLLKDFREHLDNTIYKPSEAVYKRYYKLGGFYSGWDIDKTRKFVRELTFYPDKLIHPSKDGKNDFFRTGLAHGGAFPGTEDYRQDMPWILNDITSNDEYSYAGGAHYLETTSEGYWDLYMRNIDNKVEEWLDAEFKKYGITRR